MQQLPTSAIFVTLCFCGLTVLLYSAITVDVSCRRPDNGRDDLSTQELEKVISSASDFSSIKCTESNQHQNHTTIVFMIHSATGNFKKRRVLREHARRMKQKVVFVVGQEISQTGVDQSLQQEAESFADLIIGPFIDTYTNLTLKHLFALKWAQVNCPAVDFVVKADDDILINFRELYQHVDTMYPKGSYVYEDRTSYKVIAGYLFSKKKAIRVSSGPAAKWCVTHEVYAWTEYPDYCSGWGYVTTAEAIESILQEVSTVDKGFWVDDVFVTGMLRLRAGDVFLDPLNSKYSLDPKLLMSWLQEERRCRWDRLFSSSGGSDELLERSYSRLENTKKTWPPCSATPDSAPPSNSTGRPQVTEIHI